jgi:hypothetical protein
VRLPAKELEAANLRQQVHRLKKCIERAGLPPQTEHSLTGNHGEKDYLKFIDTAMALSAVLARLHEIISLNLSNETIEVLAAPPSRRTIVGQKRLVAFSLGSSSNP